MKNIISYIIVAASATIATTHIYNKDLEQRNKEMREYINIAEYNEIKAQTYYERMLEIENEKLTYDIPLDPALQTYTYDVCKEYGIESMYEVVLALMWRESTFNESAVSDTGDYGLMQINELNYEWLVGELGTKSLLDGRDNIDAGVFMLARALHRYGDTNKALMAYNMGDRGAAELWEQGIYSSSYSRDVLYKADQIRLDLFYKK